MEWISTIVDSGNNILWTYILIILLLAKRTIFFIRYEVCTNSSFPEMFRLIVEKERAIRGFLRSKPLPLVRFTCRHRKYYRGSLSHWCRRSWCSILDVDNRDFRDGHCLH